MYLYLKMLKRDGSPPVYRSNSSCDTLVKASPLSLLLCSRDSISIRKTRKPVGSFNDLFDSALTASKVEDTRPKKSGKVASRQRKGAQCSTEVVCHGVRIR